MSIQFSEATNNTGIAQQARFLARVDANQWPIAKIVNSVNNYLDEVTGYAIGADRRFNWDDTNHSKLPIGTVDLTANQQDYAYLTDEQGNQILSLTRVDLLETSGGAYRRMNLLAEDDIEGAVDQYKNVAGVPDEYIKIADNIIRLKSKPRTTLAAGLQFYFQRTGSYFTASDTTKSPGVAPLLHRGFVIAAAYDIAITLGTKNINFLSKEMDKERNKMIAYFGGVRNRDQRGTMTVRQGGADSAQ